MEEVETEIRSLNPSTGCPINSLPTKIIKENSDIFTMKVSIDFNNTVIHSFFPEQTLFHHIKKMIKWIKLIIDL